MVAFKLPVDYWTLDFETNGLPKNEDASLIDMTEIAYTLNSLGVVSKTISQLAKPAKPLPPKIVEITHITDAMLANAPSPLEVAAQTLPELVYSPLHIVGHNIIGFDRHILDKYCELLNLPKIDKERYIDTAALFKTYRRGHRAKSSTYELPKASFFNWASNVLEKSWSEDAVKYNLDAAVGYLAVPQFGIPSDRHRALYDVVLTTRVLEVLRTEMGL